MSRNEWAALVDQIEPLAWLVKDHAQRGEWLLASHNARQLAELALSIQHHCVENIVKECTSERQ